MTTSLDDQRAPASAMTSWDVFVLRHTHPTNLRIHVVSFAMFWGGPLLALALWSPWPLLLFALSGVVGGLGHHLTEDSYVSAREATSSPLTVLYASFVVVLYLTGRYAPHIARARARAGVTESVVVDG